VLSVYDNLAHYVFNEMIRAQGSANGFDFFSPWFTIFGWILGCTALVLVIMLRLKVPPLFLLLMARSSHAMPVGLTLPKITVKPPMDVMAELSICPMYISSAHGNPDFTLHHFCTCLQGHLHDLPCVQETARTRLALEIGNETFCPQWICLTWLNTTDYV